MRASLSVDRRCGLPRRRIRVWEVAATAAVITFAAGAPFSIVLAEIGAGLAILLSLSHPRRILAALQRHRPLGAALIFYIGTQLLIGLFAEQPSISFAALRGDWHLLFLPAFLTMLTVERARRWALPTLLVAASLAGLAGAIQHFGNVDPWGRATLEPYGPVRSIARGTFSGHLTYGGILMIAFAAILGSWDERRAVLSGLALVCIGGGLIGSLARSAWIGVAAGALVWMVVSSQLRGQLGRRRLIWGPLTLIIILGVILLLPGVRERFGSIAHLTEMPRMRLWQTAARIFASHPLFGAGLGSFQAQFAIYRVPGEYLATCHPHNDLLNALANGGLAGALAWLGLWVALLHAGRRSPMLWALLATFLVAGLGQCYFTDEEPVGLLWFVLAAALSRPTPTEVARTGIGRRIEQRAKRMLLPMAARLWPPRGERALDLTRARRILLIRQDNRLGNMLLITPFLQALRRLAPQAHICAHTGDRFTEVFQESPWLDELIVERKRYLIQHPWAYPGHLRRLRRGAWDLVFELSNPDTHSFYNALLTLVSGAPGRIGFDHARSRAALSHPVARPRVECHASLAPLLLISALGAAPDILPLRLPPQWTVRTGDRILFHPGGRGSKRWPPDRARALIAALAPEVRRRLILIGGPAERQLLADLASATPGIAVRHLGTLADLVEALQDASLYVGCDAGPLHVVAALEIPILALFRTSHPLRYAPLGGQHETILLGAGSRRHAEETRFPASETAAHSIPHDEEFALQLAARRPQMVSPRGALDAAGEVTFVVDRLHQALERIQART